MMTILRLTGCVVATAIVLCLGGCGDSDKKLDTTSGGYREVAPPIELIAKARPDISDLPVPIGFKLDSSRSRAIQTGLFRFVDYFYKGSADKAAVERFYRRQMPVERWVLTTKIFAQGGIKLVFSKEADSCWILITKGSLFNPTYIKIQAWTSGRIEAPKEKTGGKSTTK